MPSRAEGLIFNRLCPESHQGSAVTLLEVGQAALAPPEVWDMKAGKKHSPQLASYGTALCGGRPQPAAAGLELDMGWGPCHGCW